MEPKPSWQSSTLSQVMVLSLMAFLIAAFGVGLGITFGKLIPELAKVILEPFTWLAGIFISSYFVARKTESNGNNGGPNGQQDDLAK